MRNLPAFHVVLIAATIYATEALMCYRCSYSKADTDSSVFSFFLGQLSKLSDEHCKLERKDDLTEISQRSCPEPDPGQVSKCVYFNGTAIASVPVLGEFRYHTLVRDCTNLDPDDSHTADGCHDDVPSTTHKMLDSAFSVLSIGEVEYKGKACYSSEDRFVGGAISTMSTVSWWRYTMAVLAVIFNKQILR